MDNAKYIGMDVHKESISIAVRNAAGKVVMECVIETKANLILDFVDGLRGDVHVTFEEGTWAAWLYDLLKPHVTRLVVCDPRRCAEAGRTVAEQPTALGLSRRPRATNAEGTGAQLSDHHARAQPGHDACAGHRSQLGHSLYWPAGLRIAPSWRMARGDRRSRAAPTS